MRICEIIFSPTGGTKKAADMLSQGLSDEILTVDLTNSQTDFKQIPLAPEDTAVIAVPSYGGRVPAPARDRILKLKGNHAKAVLLCVYGNRAYDDTLAELSDLAEQSEFRVVAAVAAVAEHSIARRYAAGRPDAKDQETLRNFAQQIRKKLVMGSSQPLSLPGNRPYRKSGGASLIPKITKACTQCGLCREKCPVQAISARNTGIVNPRKCISCMRCVSVCPRSARKVSAAKLLAVNLALQGACSRRKECELFL